MRALLVAAAVPLWAAGCLSALGGDPAGSLASHFVDGTRLSVTFSASSETIDRWETVRLGGTVTNLGPKDFTYWTAGCPGEPVLFYLQVGEELRSLDFAREPHGWQCAGWPVTLHPGDGVSHAEPWKGKVGGERLEQGRYHLVAMLNREPGIEADLLVRVR